MTEPQTPDGNVRELVRAIGALCSTIEETRLTFHCAIDDASAAIVQSVRAVGAALVGVVSANGTGGIAPSYTDMDVHYARQHGGRRIRPISEKTSKERETLQQLRMHKTKGEER